MFVEVWRRVSFGDEGNAVVDAGIPDILIGTNPEQRVEEVYPSLRCVECWVDRKCQGNRYLGVYAKRPIVWFLWERGFTRNHMDVRPALGMWDGYPRNEGALPAVDGHHQRVTFIIHPCLLPPRRIHTFMAKASQSRLFSLRGILYYYHGGGFRPPPAFMSHSLR